MNISGEMIKVLQVDLPEELGVQERINFIAEAINNMVVTSGIRNERIMGVGISSPGPIDINKGVILTPREFEKWHNVDIVNRLNRLLTWECYIENESIALAIAEKNYGCGNLYNNFILLEVDTGIGSGIIINDSLYRGVMNFGGEVGHMSISMAGRKCSCGSRGCLTKYASIPAILSSDKTKEFDTWDKLVDKAYDGNKKALNIIKKEAKYLSVGIVNIINALELEAVILAGEVSYRPNLILNLIKENTSKSLLMRKMRDLEIRCTEILDNASIISACTIVIEKFFQGEIEFENIV